MLSGRKVAQSWLRKEGRIRKGQTHRHSLLHNVYVKYTLSCGFLLFIQRIPKRNSHQIESRQLVAQGVSLQRSYKRLEKSLNWGRRGFRIW